MASSAIAAFAAEYGSAIAAGTAAAAGGVSAYESHESGVAASNQAKQKARLATDQATQQSINQRQNLLKSLAAQNNAAGAGGIGTGGSFGANAMRQINQNDQDLLVTRANGSAEASADNSAASSAILTGNIGAGASLLGSAGNAVKGYVASQTAGQN